MAIKPRESWSASYRKRIERAEAAGKSRQAARGHKPREHVTRKPKSALNTKQKSIIKQFAVKQAKLAEGANSKEFYSRMLRQAEAYGMDRFQDVINQARAWHREWVMRKKRGWLTQDFMAAQVMAFVGEPDEPRWLYYH